MALPGVMGCGLSNGKAMGPQRMCGLLFCSNAIITFAPESCALKCLADGRLCGLLPLIRWGCLSVFLGPGS